MDRLLTKRDPDRPAACECAGAQYRERAIAVTAARHDRTRQLPKILATTPEEIGDLSLQGKLNLIARLLHIAHSSARAGRHAISPRPEPPHRNLGRLAGGTRRAGCAEGSGPPAGGPPPRNAVLDQHMIFFFTMTVCSATILSYSRSCAAVRIAASRVRVSALILFISLLSLMSPRAPGRLQVLRSTPCF